MATYTKDQLIKALQPLTQSKLDIFKTKKDNDFSMTQHGYMLLASSKLYSSSFIAILDKDGAQSLNTLISLKKIFEKSPYFVKGRTVLYLDEAIHAEICLYGGISAYIKHLKVIDDFLDS